MFRLSMGLVLCFLAGCVAPAAVQLPDTAKVNDLLGNCCEAAEVYPRLLVDLVEPKADMKSEGKQPFRLRPPRLGDQPAVWSYASRYLQPLDIVLTSDKGQMNGRLSVGYMTHALVYVGTEAQLRRADLWDHPDLEPFHDRLRGGEVFFEAVPPKVDFASVTDAIHVDAISIWRPRLSAEQRYDVLTRLLLEQGKPFDRHLDSSTDDCRYCAELLSVAFPMLALIQREAYGRPVVIPDEIAASAIRGQVPLTFVGYVHGEDGAIVSASIRDLAARIGAYWPGPGTAVAAVSNR